MPKRSGSFLLPATIVSIVAIFVIGIRFYPNLLWFESLGYGNVWWFVLRSKFQAFSIFFLLAFFFLKLNVWLAEKICDKAAKSSDSPNFRPPFEFLNEAFRRYMAFKQENRLSSVSSRAYKMILNITLFVLALGLGLSAKDMWEPFYLFLKQNSFNMSDPLFNKDISFYIFNLPLLKSLQAWASSLITLTLLAVCWIFFTRNILAYLFTHTKRSSIKVHIFGLASIFLMVLAWGFQLKMYSLLYSDTGSVYGAGFTDIHGYLLGYRIVAIALLTQAVLMIVWSFQRSLKVPAVLLGAVFALWLVFCKVYPTVLQNYIVAPNEISKELPYISRNINLTRSAYKLNKIKEVPFAATQNLTQADLTNNKTTLSNIRLWNRSPLKQTFKQLQEIRLYYEFHEVDDDRYMVDGRLQQVMLSAREMDTSQLSSQAQTWVNKHLIYTHGYGLCMSPVNEVTPEGLPNFYIKDLPPVSSIDLEINRPEIYFGEKTTDYVITNTNQPEFNYPKGSSNEHTKYKGSGGIELSSLFKRVVYAFKFSDLKILISSYITGESRLLYDRTIKQMANAVTPYIIFDQDPYLIVTKEGALKWVLDGYTISNKYPYSEPFKGGINYIRNAVVATIDAYTGELDYYIKDKTDPIILTYQKIYPNVFKSFSEIPPSIKTHIRYPKDLFTVQANMYNTYHMTEPQVFYNREDLWEIPKENYGEQEKLMEPYYVIVKLPEEQKESFALMIPFTPTNKNNMIAWLSAKSDPDNYGELNVYKFPKERTIFGPMQIESRIDQNTDISKDLTLWGQMGSRVIRGHLMVIPVDGALLYAEPIYLQATQSKLPELKRVILAYKDTIVMRPSLDEAIAAVLGKPLPHETNFSTNKTHIPSKSLQEAIKNLKGEIQRYKKTMESSFNNIDKMINSIEQYDPKQ